MFAIYESGSKRKSNPITTDETKNAETQVDSTGEELRRPVALYLDNDVREVAIEGVCKMLFATKLREEISDAR